MSELKTRKEAAAALRRLRGEWRLLCAWMVFPSDDFADRELWKFVNAQVKEPEVQEWVNKQFSGKTHDEVAERRAQNRQLQYRLQRVKRMIDRWDDDAALRKSDE